MAQLACAQTLPSVTVREEAARETATGPVQHLDGLQRTCNLHNTTRPGPHTLERVELLRGPSLRHRATSAGWLFSHRVNDTWTVRQNFRAAPSSPA